MGARGGGGRTAALALQARSRKRQLVYEADHPSRLLHQKPALCVRSGADEGALSSSAGFEEGLEVGTRCTRSRRDVQRIPKRA